MAGFLSARLTRYMRTSHALYQPSPGLISYVQTTAPISPGSSGGALVDSKGALVGITTFLLKDAENINFAIAAEEFWR